MTTTRFPNGFTNAAEGDDLGTLIEPSPIPVYQLFDDFNNYDASDWAISGAVITHTLLDFISGVLEFDQSDLGESLFRVPSKNFQFIQGDRLWFKIGLLTTTPSSDLDSTDLEFGLRDDTSNGVFFLYSANSLKGRSRLGGVSTDVTLLSTESLFPVANTLQEFTFHYDGEESVLFYVDDVHLGTINTADVNFTDAMQFFFSVNPLTNDPIKIGIDYIYIGRER